MPWSIIDPQGEQTRDAHRSLTPVSQKKSCFNEISLSRLRLGIRWKEVDLFKRVVRIDRSKKE
jgi:hypothetical protein